MTFAEFDALGKFKRTKCPECGKKQSVKQTYEDVLHSSVKNTSTIGQLAEKNAKKLGKTKLEEDKAIKEAKQPKRKDPWYGSLDKNTGKKIFSGTIKEQKQKVRDYVNHGKT
jgi:dTDP-4-dehydrorhamnose reductase